MSDCSIVSCTVVMLAHSVTIMVTDTLETINNGDDRFPDTTVFELIVIGPSVSIDVFDVHEPDTQVHVPVEGACSPLQEESGGGALGGGDGGGKQLLVHPIQEMLQYVQ